MSLNKESIIPPVQYVLLIRHGSRQKPHDVIRHHHHLENHECDAQADKRGKRSPGRPLSLSLGGWLAETLRLYDIEVVDAIHSPEKHVIETEQAFLESLRPQGRCASKFLKGRPDLRLAPLSFWHNQEQDGSLMEISTPPANGQTPTFHTDLAKQIAAQATQNGKALMITGHQPQLTWLAQALTRKQRPLPLDQSEVACIQLAPHDGKGAKRPFLLWAISKQAPEVEQYLRDKIKSKMDVAKFFAGFIAVLLGFVLQEIGSLTEQSGIYSTLAYLGTLLVLLALGFAIAGIFAYDKLLMPSLFWSGSPMCVSTDGHDHNLRRPPTQSHWVLYFAMIRIWRGLFVPAVVALYLGIVLLLVAKAKIQICWSVTGALPALIVVAVACWVDPRMGFDD